MTHRMRRTRILLEPQQHQAVVEIARRERRSVSDLVREMIRQQLEQRKQAAEADLERRLAALERIRQHREQILARRGGKPIEIGIVEMINQMREEQDEKNLSLHSADLFHHRHELQLWSGEDDE